MRLFAVVLSVATLQAQPGGPKQVVLTIGSETITAAEYEELVNALPEQSRVLARGPGRRKFAEQLADVKTLAQEARRRGVDETPAFKSQLALQADNLLASLLFQTLANTVSIDETTARKYYDEHLAEYEQARARHILVRMKGSPAPASPGRPELSDEEALAKARALRKRLLEGEDFAALAKAESDDTGSGAAGGDLGAFKRGQMVAPFEQAAFSLPLSQVSEPVRSPFGYHLILVEKRETRAFEQARAEIERKMRPEAARRLVESLRKSTLVRIDEEYFGPAKQ